MIGFFYRLFNHDKIDRLNQRLKEIDEAMTSMEAELREYKGYKLKYRVAQMYVEDDEALLELFELAKEKEKAEYSSAFREQSQQRALYGSLHGVAAAQSQQRSMAQQRGLLQSSAGMIGASCLGIFR